MDIPLPQPAADGTAGAKPGGRLARYLRAFLLWFDSTATAQAAEAVTYLFPAPDFLPAFAPFQLAKHKGYPTKLHYELIAQYGIQPFYRRSFLKKQGYWP